MVLLYNHRKEIENSQLKEDKEMTNKNNNEVVRKCKDCKYFKREAIRASRSGVCTHEMWKNKGGGGTSCSMGCGTKACENFKR